MPKLSEIQQSLNVKLPQEKLDEIGRDVVDRFKKDKESRKEWEKKMEKAIELAQQMVKEKHTPWQHSSNVKFPLLTIAALQFHARAYPQLTKGPSLVKVRKTGADPKGEKMARAERIGAHMSYQMLEQDEQWEEDQDRAFIALPILGCIFKKSYHYEYNKSRLVLPQNLVVNYYTKTIEDSE